MTKTPTGLKRRGAAFWRHITSEFDPSAPELELLLEVCRTIDVVEALAGSDDLRSLAELRQQRLVLGRLLAQLQIPGDQAIESPTTIQARKAAQARWRNHPRRAQA